MIYGLDVLGLAKYPEIIKYWPNGYAAGVFASEFGDALRAVDKLLATGKCPVLRMQLIWSSTHSYGNKDIPEIKQQSHRYELLAQKYKKVKFYISPFCESNVASPDKYLDLAQKYAPSCTIVNSIWKGGLSKKYINEVHGSNAKALKGKYIFSADGNSSNNSDMEKIKATHKNAELFFLWTASCNGKGKDQWGKDEKPIPPKLRKIWPTQNHIEAIKWLTTNKEG